MGERVAANIILESTRIMRLGDSLTASLIKNV